MQHQIFRRLLSDFAYYDFASTMPHLCCRQKPLRNDIRALLLYWWWIWFCVQKAILPTINKRKKLL